MFLRRRLPNRAFACALVFTLITLAPARSLAQSRWEPPQRRYPTKVYTDNGDRERDWVFVSSAMPAPLDPPEWKYFSARPGWGFGYSHPVAEWCDVGMELEDFRLPFRESKFREDFSPVSVQSDRALFSQVMIVGRFHGTQTGLRPYALVGVGLPNISRPAITYSTATTTFTQIEGAELFAIDPGFELGAGCEYRKHDGVSGFGDVRLSVFPGRTEPAQSFVLARLGVLVHLPRWPGW